jgi:hypothetical protein
MVVPNIALRKKVSVFFKKADRYKKKFFSLSLQMGTAKSLHWTKKFESTAI